MPRRWDEDHGCKYCEDAGTFEVEFAGETHVGFCGCEAGDEAHEAHALALDGWAA